jgi:hypothetical protein
MGNVMMESILHRAETKSLRANLNQIDNSKFSGQPFWFCNGNFRIVNRMALCAFAYGRACVYLGRLRGRRRD